MGDLFAQGAVSAYPTSLDTATAQVDSNPTLAFDTTSAHASKPNNLAQAIINLETELGTLPKGTSASVKEKIAGLRSLASASADTIVVTADSPSRVGIRTSTPTTDLELVGDGVAASIAGTRYSADATGPSLQLRKSRGSVSSPAVPTTNDVLGNTNYSGHSGSGTTFNTGARIRAMADESFAVGSAGSHIDLDTVPTGGSTTLSTRLRLTTNVILNFDGVGFPQFAGTNTTGGGSAALGTNCPAVTPTAPYTWIQALSSDGSTVYFPVWK